MHVRPCVRARARLRTEQRATRTRRAHAHTRSQPRKHVHRRTVARARARMAARTRPDYVNPRETRGYITRSNDPQIAGFAFRTRATLLPKAESKGGLAIPHPAGICCAERRSGKILAAIYAIIERTWNDDESNDRINPIPPPPPKYVRRIDRGASARRARAIRTADATLFDLDPSP